MKTRLFTFILLATMMMSNSSCSSDDPLSNEEEKVDNNKGNSSNNTNSNNTSNGNSSGNNNNSNGGNDNNNSNVEKKTSLTFTIKIQNKTGLTPASNIGVNISGVNISQRKETNSSGVCVFDDLNVPNGITLSYKVTGLVTKNGVSSLREITGSIKVSSHKSHSIIATF